MSLVLKTYLMLSVLTLNVQGFRNLDKQREVVHFSRARGADLVFLQEVNFFTQLDVKRFQDAFGIPSYFSLATSRACGVGVLILNPSLCWSGFSSTDGDGRVLLYNFTVGSSRFKIINIYAPASVSFTNAFFRAVGVYFLDSAPTILCGDFNCVTDSVRDVRGPGQGRPNWNAAELETLINDYHLQDAWTLKHGDNFSPTWRRGCSQSRLDRFYVTQELVPAVVDIRTETFPSQASYVSDHSPVILYLKIDDNRFNGVRHWRLDTRVLHDPQTLHNFKNRITETLSTTSNLSWDNLKTSWRVIAQEESKRLKSRFTTELNDTISRIRIIKRGEPLSAPMNEVLGVLRDRYQLQLSRSSPSAAAFNKYGPCNGSIEINRFLKTRETPTTITAVRTPSNTISSNPTDIRTTFLSFFSQLFEAPTQQPSTNYTTEHIKDFCGDLPQVPQDVGESLLSATSTTEVFNVLKGMKTGSAPGPDGLPTEFYTTFWPELADTIVSLFNSILETNVVPDTFKQGRLVLIHKSGKDPLLPKSYRPITVLNADYKIFASLLVARMRSIWPDLISPEQTCAVPYRNIFSALNLTRDLIAYTNHTQNSGFCLSLDQEQAFDRVSHNYLYASLAAFNFPPQFVNLFSALYSGLSSDLCINGLSQGNLAIGRGVRQGCPLSPMLFVLCLDPFIRKICGNPSIRGLPLPGQGSVSVSAYADDISVFVRDGDSINALIHDFTRYSEMSGAKLNMDKSTLQPIGCRDTPHPAGFRRVTQTKILGVWFNREGTSPDQFEELVEEVNKEVERANTFPFSFSEKAYLIKCILLPKVFYVGRIAPLPEFIVNKLTRLVFRFFWGGNTERLARDAVRLPRRLGGFGLPCISATARLLALRVLVNIIHETSSPARTLALFFLGPSRRLFAPHLGGNLYPSAGSQPPMYKAVLEVHRELLALDPALDVRETQPARLGETLVWKRAGQRVDPPDFPWGLLTAGNLPERAKDIQWQRAWRVLPTKDRLRRWGITANDACPNCGRPETTEHVVSSCVVAKCFWRLIHRASPGLGLGRYCAGGRCPRDAFARLCVVLGEQALWHNRCKAVAQDRRLRLQWPLIADFRKEVRSFLVAQLFRLGEEEFLQQWSCPFVRVQEGGIKLDLQFPDVFA